MIICKNCGYQNEDDDAFCGSCGTFLEWAGERLAEPEPEPEPEPQPEQEPEPEKAGFMDRVKSTLGMGEEDRPDGQAGNSEHAAAAEAPVAEVDRGAPAGSGATAPEQPAATGTQPAPPPRIEPSRLDTARPMPSAASTAGAPAGSADDAAVKTADPELSVVVPEAQTTEAVREREEVERKAREEAEAKQRELAERRRAEEDRRAREGAERTAREEAQAKQREEAERKQAEEAEARKREEEDAAREEEAARARQEARAREEAERKAQQEEDRHAQAASMVASAEAVAKARKEAEAKKRAEEEARKRAEEEARRQREEEEARRLLAEADEQERRDRAAALVAKPPEASTSDVAARTPSAQRPAPQKERRAKQQVKAAPTRTIKPGDLICGQCGEVNDSDRKFCRRCGDSLVKAEVAKKVPWFKRTFQRKPMEAGARRGRAKAGDRKRSAKRGFRRILSLFGKLRMAVGLLAMAGVLSLAIPSWRGLVFQTANGAFNTVRIWCCPKAIPITPASATADSLARHPADLLIDGGNNTHWSERAEGNGVGEEITFAFEEPVEVFQMIFLSGAQDKMPQSFRNQPRPREMTLDFFSRRGGRVIQTVKVALVDDFKPQTREIGVKEVRFLRIRIDSVFGQKGDDLSMTEVEFFTRG